MSDNQPPRIPEIGEYVRNFGVLREIQDVTKPVVQELDYVFEDTAARVEARVNGKVIKAYSTFNNFYGRDMCVAHAIEEAKKLAESAGPSDLDFVVVRITSRRRMRPTGRRNFYEREYVEMEALPCGASWGMPDDVEQDIWSTKRGPVALDTEDASVISPEQEE